MKKMLMIAFLLGCFVVDAQQPNTEVKIEKDKDFQFHKDSLLFDWDTTMLRQDSVYALEDLIVLSRLVFKNEREENYFNRLKYKVYRVYPYYLKASREYQNIMDSMDLSKKDRKMRKKLKERKKQLSDEYEEKLKSLTKWEGQILVKLMHRKTGKTTYEIIKDLDGGWDAFWWNAKAGAVNIDLKSEFDPVLYREDFYINYIILKGIRDHRLRSDE